MVPLLLDLDVFVIPTSVVTVVLGLAVCLWLLLRNCRRFGLHWKIALDAFIGLVAGALIFGRLVVVLRALEWFRDHWRLVTFLPAGGLDLLGAVVGGLLGIAVVTLWYRENFLRLADAFAVLLPLFAVFVGIGAFLNGSGFGRLTEVPWGMTLEDPRLPTAGGFPRHPAQLYWALLNLGLFLLITTFYSRKFFHGFFLAIWLGLFPVTLWISGWFNEAALSGGMGQITLAGAWFNWPLLAPWLLFFSGLGLLVFGQRQRL